MNSKDGHKNRNRPDPIQRPGVSNTKKKTFGATRMNFAEADAWLAGEGVTYRDTENDLLT